MLRMTAAIVAALSVSACGEPGATAEQKKENKNISQVTEIKTIDFNCSAGDQQAAEPFDLVNRISLDLVNNRIDMFSKNQIWQFHGVEAAGGDRHSINIAFVGNNIAAWGIDKHSPYSFFFNRSNSNITFSIINGGQVKYVVYKC